MSTEKYTIREYRPGDELGIVATFNEVFANGDARFVGHNLASWRWAFQDNPAGMRVFVATTSIDGQERIVAQCAAQPLRMIVEGQAALFAQGVDSMTHPQHRQGLKRPGLFVNTANAFFDRYSAVDRDVVHFGLPIEQAYKMGALFLRYEVVRTQQFLVHTGSDTPAEWPIEVEKLGAFDEQARWLYDRCSGAFGASAVRDAAFLEWRFSRPGATYIRLGVRDASGILRGLAVFRRCHLVVDDVGVVCEWLVPPDETAVAELLERALRRLAFDEGAAISATLLPDWSPWFLWFQDRGWRVHPTSYMMCSRHFARRLDPAWLRRNWWYTLADTDLV